MTKNPLELILGSLDDKKQWRAYRARVKGLPEPYRTTVAAIERYLLHSGDSPTDWPRAQRMFDDLADLFDRAAVDGTPVRDIVGDDPHEFVDEFVKTYSDGGWAAKERDRLRTTIERAADEESKS